MFWTITCTLVFRESEIGTDDCTNIFWKLELEQYETEVDK